MEWMPVDDAFSLEEISIPLSVIEVQESQDGWMDVDPGMIIYHELCERKLTRAYKYTQYSVSST